MSLLYVDTSALIRVYFVDEPDHEELSALLIEGSEAAVSSELTRVELASAVAAAVRARRLRQPELVLDRFDADCADDGPLTLLRLDAKAALPLARTLVTEHRLRTLDAIHIAVALTDASALAMGEPLVLVTRDRRQAEAAKELGLTVA